MFNIYILNSKIIFLNYKTRVLDFLMLIIPNIESQAMILLSYITAAIFVGFKFTNKSVSILKILE